jgi:hypothetical protein
MRVQSDRPARNGGWLHDAGATPRPYAPSTSTKALAPPPDLEGLHRWFVNAVRPPALTALAERLGVQASALTRLGIGWAKTHHAWSFPMFDSKQRLVGIRLRGADNGDKWAVEGSHNGLFWPNDLRPQGLLLVCEGPTDTAALLGLGYDAIGRPSCSGAVEMVIEAIRGMPRRDVVIVADADPPRVDAQGRIIRPGLDGARRLAAELTAAGRRPKIILPLTPHKDVRAWVCAGATRDALDAMIATARYWRGT